MHGISRLRLFRALALVGAAFVLLVNAAGAQGVSPSAVVDSFERALAEPNEDAALSRLGDTAIITVYGTRTRTLTTRSEIRDFLTNNLASPQQPRRTSPHHVDGNTVRWNERTTPTEFLSARDLTVEATVENGKIQSLAYRIGRVATLPGAPAPGITSESATMSGSGLLLLGLGLLTLTTARQHVRSGSNLRGRLLPALRHYGPRRKAATTEANASGAS